MTHPAILYALTVLIWGSTWFAIKFQLGTVEPAVSVAYRFLLAAALLFAWCWWRAESLRFSPRSHMWMMLLGLSLFGLNYLLFYYATVDLTSGLVAVAFSTIVIFNIANAALWLKTPIQASAVIGGLLGIGGIVLVFWPELDFSDTSQRTSLALLVALLATVSASFGNVISARNQREGLSVMPTNAWAMSYGALFMLAWALLNGMDFGLEIGWPYILSLGYLVVFGSIIAFGSYLTLIGKIGPAKAAYATVLFPLVALAISAVFENYRWGPTTIAGVMLVVVGNIVILRRGPRGTPRDS